MRITILRIPKFKIQFQFLRSLRDVSCVCVRFLSLFIDTFRFYEFFCVHICTINKGTSVKFYRLLYVINLSLEKTIKSTRRVFTIDRHFDNEAIINKDACKHFDIPIFYNLFRQRFSHVRSYSSRIRRWTTILTSGTGRGKSWFVANLVHVYSHGGFSSCQGA